MKHLAQHLRSALVARTKQLPPVRLNTSTVEAVKAAAAEDGMSLSAWVEKALAHVLLERRLPPPGPVVPPS